MDRSGMEDFGAWSPLARLSLDENRTKAIGFRTLSLAKTHNRDCRDHESGEENGRNGKFPVWWRKRRDEELHEVILSHLTLSSREGMDSDPTQREARFAACAHFGT